MNADTSTAVNHGRANPPTQAKKHQDHNTLDKPTAPASFTATSWEQPRTLTDAIYWRPSEIDFLRHWHGRLPEKEIAAKLNRTPTAVHQMCIRLGILSVTTWDNLWVAAQLARAAGISEVRARGLLKAAPRMMTDEGLQEAPLRGFPSTQRYQRNTPITVVYKERLRLWLGDPLNHWVLHEFHELANVEELSGVIKHTRARWHDQWLAVRQAPQHRFVSHQAVSMWIRKGLLPNAVLFRQWFVRASELDALLEERF